MKMMMRKNLRTNDANLDKAPARALVLASVLVGLLLKLVVGRKENRRETSWPKLLLWHRLSNQRRAKMAINSNWLTILMT